jgi:hypothetical protein
LFIDNYEIIYFKVNAGYHCWSLHEAVLVQIWCVQIIFVYLSAKLCLYTASKTLQNSLLI